MSDISTDDLNSRDILARIDRNQAEVRKLLAEAAKFQRERAYHPFQVMIGGIAAGGALVGGTVALMKWLGG